MPLLKKVLIQLIPNVRLTTPVPFGGRIQFLARTHKGFLVRRVTDYSHEACIFQYYKEAVSPQSIVFDVGANIGLHTVPLALLAKRGTIVAFEPDVDNLNLLQGNLLRNRVSDRVIVVPKAVSDTIGTARFWRDIVSSATGTLEPKRDNSWFHEYTGQKPIEAVVETTTIDDFVAAHPSLTPDLIKIDVEGAELKVVDGMKRTLCDIAPDIIIDGMLRECIEPLIACGYELADLINRSPIRPDIVGQIPFTVLGRSSKRSAIARRERTIA